MAASASTSSAQTDQRHAAFFPFTHTGQVAALRGHPGPLTPAARLGPLTAYDQSPPE
jgi:hypothetical protein